MNLFMPFIYYGSCVVFNGLQLYNSKKSKKFFIYVVTYIQSRRIRAGLRVKEIRGCKEGSPLITVPNISVFVLVTSEVVTNLYNPHLCETSEISLVENLNSLVGVLRPRRQKE